MSAVRAPCPRVGGSFELYAWFFMRVSGVIMLFLAVGHLLYMHLAVGVESIDYAWILRRWANPIWRLYDWMLLVFAVVHGTNGVRTVLDDVLPKGVPKVVLKWALYATLFTFLAMGTQIIVTAPRP